MFWLNNCYLCSVLLVIENNYYSVAFPARKDLYYAYRDQYNSEGIHPDERAALFIFLNHTCFNGLYRVNAAGKFNVHYGRYKKPVISNEELIMADHYLLGSVELIIRQPGDYKNVIRNLSRKNVNFIYLDPPYKDTTSYGFDFELKPFINKLLNSTNYPIYVSEKEPISNTNIRLKFNGAKGGISGNKNGKNEEWLNVYGNIIMT